VLLVLRKEAAASASATESMMIWAATMMEAAETASWMSFGVTP